MTDSESRLAEWAENQSQPSLLSENETQSEDSDSNDSGTESSNESEDDPKFGRWPRRLLHVDRERGILTSHQWESGNVYGGWKEPKYNAISYTWGRFQLQPGERPDVQAIDIKGVPWAIPRIDPDKHFSVQEFRSTIMTACDARDTYGRGKVEFIWLDVACIDQEKYQIKMLEVGRQAVIFQYAEATCVWLASSPCARLEQLTMDLWEASYFVPPSDKPIGPDHKAELEHWLHGFLEKTIDHIKYIIEREPWFTSLWTLQESFLRPFANLLAGEGCFVPFRREGWEQSFPYATLRTVASSVATIADVCGRCLYLRCDARDRIHRLLSWIRQTGLLDIQQANPFQLLRAASFRQVYDQLDRVYGIMQIFGFKLGASKPKTGIKKSGLKALTPLRKRLTLSDLELELSQKILEAYPVQSQLGVFTMVPDPGWAWRLSSTSEITYIARTSSLFLWRNNRGPDGARNGKDAQRSLCQLSTTSKLSIGRRHLHHFHRGISVLRNVFRKPVTWCKFSGKTCPLATLHPIWSWLNTPGVRYNSNFTYPSQNIALDLERDHETSELIATALPMIPLVGYEIQNWKQDDVIAQLVDRFPASQLVVLCLGAQRKQTEHEGMPYMGKTFYGLLMVRKAWRGTEYWRRIGIVSWEAFDFPRAMAARDILILKVKSNEWKLTQGIHG